jgi:class 3 adenylate cyclase
MERRLTAILVADVVGYSRLMGTEFPSVIGAVSCAVGVQRSPRRAGDKNGVRHRLSLKLLSP